MSAELQQPLFELKNAVKRHGREKAAALNDVSLSVAEGARLAIVGESGSGKSTLLRVLLGLTALNSGNCYFRGETLTPQTRRVLHKMRAQTGVIMQDPGTGFNPFLPLKKSIFEPVPPRLYRANQSLYEARLSQLLAQMQLPADAATRFAHEFSGGQRQRLAAVRALINEPAILVSDEPVSALDVLAREKFLTALDRATQERNITLITVTHDLAVVPRVANEVAVLKDGVLVEHGDTQQILTSPEHSYTKQLVSAAV